MPLPHRRRIEGEDDAGGAAEGFEAFWRTFDLRPASIEEVSL